MTFKFPFLINRSPETTISSGTMTVSPSIIKSSFFETTSSVPFPQPENKLATKKNNTTATAGKYGCLLNHRRYFICFFSSGNLSMTLAVKLSGAFIFEIGRASCRVVVYAYSGGGSLTRHEHTDARCG